MDLTALAEERDKSQALASRVMHLRESVPWR